MSGEPMPIRAHTLLCLQGYRGLGYDEKFIDRMDEISAYLAQNPYARIRVTASTDIICECCPHNIDGLCAVDEEAKPSLPTIKLDNSKAMDHRVLQHLDLEEDSVQVWAEILDILANNIQSSDMDHLCRDCRWKIYGYCAEAFDRLARLDLNA